MMSFWNAIGIPGALAALVLATTPTASAFEYTDGDQRPIQDRDAQETRVSVGIPWAKQTILFPSQKNTTGKPWIDGTIELSAVKTCRDGSVILALQIKAENYELWNISHSIDEFIIDGYANSRTWISREPRRNVPQQNQDAEYHQLERNGDKLHFYFELLGTANPFFMDRKRSKNGPITYLRTNSPFMARKGTITIRSTRYDRTTEPDGTSSYSNRGSWETTVEGVMAPGGTVVWDRHFRPCFSVPLQYMIDPAYREEPSELERLKPEIQILPLLPTLR